MIQPIRLGVLTTIYKRPELTRIVLGYYRGLDLSDVRCELVLACAGSEGDASRELAESCGWHYVEAPNDPLSDKFNAASEAFRDLDVDGVVIIGSDDLLSRPYLRYLAKQLRNGVDLTMLRSLYFADVSGPETRVVFAEQFGPGAGVCLSRRVCTGQDWQLWTPGLNKYLDGHLYSRAQKFAKKRGHVFSDIESDRLAVDVKSGFNIWSWKEINDYMGKSQSINVVEVFDPDSRFSRIFPGVWQTIKDLRHHG